MSKAVKAVASVAVGVAVGFVAGPWAGFAAGAAVFGASGAMTPKMDVGASTQGELKQVVRSSKEPAHYQFGPCAVGGLLAWAQEEPGRQDRDEWLHMVYVLSEGEIEALDEVYLNQEPASAAGDRLRYALIRNPGSADGYLLQHSPDWRDAQIGTGLSYVRVSLRYDRDYWASGIPTPLFVMRGCRDIHDPRSGGTGYSDNVALVILWYLRARLGVPDDEIIWEMFVSAANVCDESITTPTGGSERRYTCGGGFKADARKDRVLADLEAACAGQVVRIGGRFGLIVGAYYGPHELTIDEDMVIGAVSGQTEVAQADAVNTMRGKFVDPGQRWTETDYPAVAVYDWIAEDGGEIEDTLDLQYVTSPYQAQRLANIQLRRKRAGGTLSLPLNFRGYSCRPGRVVRVNLPSLHIEGEFQVVDWEFHGDSGCKVSLRAEQPEIYDDAVGEPYDPLGFISLPTGGVAAPSGLTYTLEAVGEAVQGRLDWSAVSGAQHYNVTIRNAEGVAVQAAQVPPGTTTCRVSGLTSGNYVAEVRTQGAFGMSGAATVTIRVNAPPVPERVIVQATNNDITLIPKLDWPGPVSFRFYYSPTPLAAAAVRGSAELLSTGAILVHTGRAIGTNYYYWVESVNAYGHSDLYYVEVTTTEDFDEIFSEIDQHLRREGGLVDQFENGINNNSTAIEDARRDIEQLDDRSATTSNAVERAQRSIEEAARQDEVGAVLERLESAISATQAGVSSATQTVEQLTRASNDAALSERITELTSTFDGDRLAQLRDQLTTLADEKEAIAQSLRDLRADYEDSNVAGFNQRLNAMANDIEAVSQSVEELTAALDDSEARIDETRRVIAVNDIREALTSAVSSTQTALGSAAQRVETLTRVNEDEALSQRIVSLNADFGRTNASINSIERAQALDNLALTLQNSVAQAQNSVSSAAIKTERITSVNERRAVAQQQENYRAEVEGELAQVQRDISAVYDPRTGAVAQAVTTVEAGGRRALVGIRADGEVAEVVAIANRFAVINPVSGELLTAFVVQDGRVIIPEAFIDALTITKLRAEDGSLAFENGRLRADLIDARNLTAGSVVSRVTASNGRPTFALRSNGGFELNASFGDGRTEQDGSGFRAFDGSGRLRVRIGRLE